jgi:hypothetical protein
MHISVSTPDVPAAALHPFAFKGRGAPCRGEKFPDLTSWKESATAKGGTMTSGIRAREVFRAEKRGQLGGSFRAEKCKADTRCPKCELIFQNGAWKRGVLASKHELRWKLCPACLQIRDNQIGGTIKCTGSFIENHRQEILNRISNVARQTSEGHPLERIISTKENKNEIVISATTEHLVARIGKALERDFGGALELRYAPEDKYATAQWHRDI